MTNPIHTTEPLHLSHALPTLVATDDSEAARAAIRIATVLAAAGRIDPQVIVVDPMPMADVAGVTLDPGKVMYAFRGVDALSERRAEVRKALSAAGAGDWHLRLRAGDPVERIVGEATQGKFELLMIGLRHHGALDRVVRHETALRISRDSEVPVFAVAYWLHRVPRRIIVGLDFSRSSVRATEMACRLLDENGTIVLAYAHSHFQSPYEEIEGLATVYERGVEAELASLIERLPLPVGARAETVAIGDSPGPTLLEMAGRQSADVIAVGRQHHPGINRVLLGSVSADLIRDARCSVLVTPLLHKQS